jgi:hypothetical protein
MRAFLWLVSIVLRLAGLTLIIFGLWFSTGGLRMIVSGRIDERQEAEKSLKLGLPLLAGGIGLLLFGIWMEKHI